MLILMGEVRNTFRSRRGTTKAGDPYGGKDKVQIEAAEAQGDGTEALRLVDLAIDDPDVWEAQKGKQVQVPVTAFSPARGQVILLTAGRPEFT